MGLEDLIPDGTGTGSGGRPKSRDLGDMREPFGNPFLPERDTEEWWKEQFAEKCKVIPPSDDFETIARKIARLSDWVGLHPVEVRKKLEEHDIYETDWEEYRNYYDDKHLDSRVPGIDGPPFEHEISDEPWDTTEEREKSGLHSLIENAKE